MPVSLLEKKPLKRKALSINQDEKFIYNGLVSENIWKGHTS